MIGIFILYFIGKQYAELAFEHNRTRWVFVVLGILSYYAGFYLFQIIFGFTLGITGNAAWLDTANIFVIMLISVPAGILSTVGLYYALRNHWRKNPKVVQGELLDSNLKSNKEEF